MKKYLFIFLIFIVSCTKNTITEDENIILTNKNNNSELLTKSESIAISIEDSNNLEISEENALKLLNIKLNNSTKILSAKLQSKNELFYEYNINGGYALVSTDKRIPEVFCIVEKGTISDTSYNQGLKIFFHGLRNYIKGEKIKMNNIDSLKRSANEKIKTAMVTKSIPEISTDNGWVYIGDRYVKTYPILKEYNITTKWGQYSPFNANLPLKINDKGNYVHTSAGCGVTAVAQLMAFHKKGLYTTEVWNKVISTNYNYELQHLYEVIFDEMIIKNKNSYEYDYAESTLSDSKSFLQKFGYDCSRVANYSFDRIVEAMNYGPTLVKGNLPNNGYGHDWIVEGARKEQTQLYEIYELEYGDRIITEELLQYSYVRSEVKINWGWKGEDDGWFTSGAFNTDNGELNNSNEMILNIH
ncbi:MAG: C10 family peptidase [Rikenellaceae bacterium]